MKLINIPMNHPAFAEQTWGDAAWQHHAVMSLFGELGRGSAARATGHVLFRVEEDRPAPDGTHGRVVVQSSVAPTSAGVRVTDLDDLLGSYADGQDVRLLLRANTVRTINRTHAGEVRTHRARVPDVDLPGWFATRLADAVVIPKTTVVLGDGSEVEAADVKHVSGELRRGRAQLITTTFHARGRIVDAEALRHHVVDGVGRAKAYGCGMLTALTV